MPDKVVVRLINSRSPKPVEDHPAPQTIVVYHWHRIVAALVVVVLLLAGIVAGVRHVLPDSDDADQAPAKRVAASAGKPHGAPAGAGPPAPKAQAALKQQPGGTPTVQPEAGSRAPVNVSQSSPHKPARTDASPSSRVLIKSPNIKRARLTSNVVDGVAVDELGGTVPMNAKGLLKIFLQTEMAGLKGRVLFHDWYWKDKLIAHARVPVTREVQSSVTSKFIDRIMTGPWQVKVVDERKKVYAEVRFEVR